MPNLVGRLIGERYRIEQVVARGGMATVYLAMDIRLERKVALKIIHPHLASDNSFREKFIREARIAAKLSHPNLVNVFDQGEDGDLAFMAMEYVSGITLRDALKDFGALDARRALELFEPMLSGLAAAHHLPGVLLHGLIVEVLHQHPPEHAAQLLAAGPLNRRRLQLQQPQGEQLPHLAQAFQLFAQPLLQRGGDAG